jgi:uncharacterized protein YndB with AHSA1/START domain
MPDPVWQPAAAGHDIVSARDFPVPRATLYAAFADPARLAAWWGPRGSVNHFEIFDLRPGGAWRFVMRAAGGAEYPMNNEFVEVRPPERVVVRHLQAGHEFALRMDFEALGPGRSRLHWRMRFDSPAEAERVRALVLEANEQNFDRLAALLARDAAAASASRARAG